MFKRTVLAVLAMAAFWAASGKSRAGDSLDVQQDAPREADGNRPVKRLLLIGQGPDSHPWGTHEYLAGMRLLAQCLQPVSGVQTIVVSADAAWPAGPELIESADGVVLFVSEGAKWIHEDARRLAALNDLAERGGGFVCWHWGMGCRDAKYIDGYLKLFGGCHGGPDRKYKVVKNVAVDVLAGEHPVTRGIGDFRIDEEFYYRLKFVKPEGSITPLIRVSIDGREQTVCWAWKRPGGGRSFGFSGGHFHNNWEREEYRRLMTQATLWSIRVPLPEQPLPLVVSKKVLEQPRPKPDAEK